jgi:hypothetical protein
MKFTKLDINSCLLYSNIPNFSGEIEYIDAEGRQNGNIGKMSIGISIFTPNHIHCKAIYIIEQEITNPDEVYSYSFIGLAGGFLV